MTHNFLSVLYCEYLQFAVQMPDIWHVGEQKCCCCTLQIWRKCSQLLLTDLFICRGKQYSLISRSDASMLCLSPDCGAAEDVGPQRQQRGHDLIHQKPWRYFYPENCGSPVHFSFFLRLKHKPGPVQARKRPQIRMLSWSSVSRRGEARAAAAAGGVRLAENHRYADAAFFFPSQDAPGRFLLVCLQLPRSGL